MAIYTRKRPAAGNLQPDCADCADYSLQFLPVTQQEKALWLNGIAFSVLRYLLLSVFLGVFSGNAGAVDLTFQTKITPSPCTVTLGGGNNGGGNWDFGNLQTSGLIYPAASASKVFTLSLSGCGVDATTALLFTPRITVSAGAGTSSPNHVFLYRGSASTSTGFGFLLNFNNTVSKWAGNGVAANDVANINSSNCTQITTTPNACKAALPANWWSNTPINIAVAVTSSPISTPLQAGSLTASVTFTFDYP